MSIERTEIGPHVLYRGDCLEVLPTLAAASVDAVVTDPPYGIVNKFGEQRTSANGRRRLQFAWDNAGVPEMVKRSLAYAFRAASAASAAFVFVGLDIVATVQGQMRASGYTPKPFALVKKHPPPAAPGTWWPSAFELAIYGYRQGAWFGDSSTKRRNVLTADTYRNGQPGKVDHPTQKMLSVMEYLTRSLAPEGAIVLDPFMGSGTTGVACARQRRRFIGVEIDASYYDLACKRIESEHAQGKLDFEQSA